MTHPDELAWNQAADESDFETTKMLERKRAGLTWGQELDILKIQLNEGKDVKSDARRLLRELSEYARLRDSLTDPGSIGVNDGIWETIAWLETVVGE